jgi:type IV pilus assembly protein PilC
VAKFKYTALTKEGKQVSGVTESVSKEALIESLHRQHLKPLVVGSAKKRGEISFGGKSVKRKELVVFTRQLSTMVSAGVPLNRSLNTLSEQADSKYFKEVIANVSKDVEGGANIGDSIAKYPRIFNDVYVNMVKAGEAGGILDEILKRLATQLEKDESMRKQIKSAMTYPVVIGSITVLAFYGIMTMIMPKLGGIIKDLGGEDAELPAISQFMLTASDLMSRYSVLILIATAIVIYLLVRYIRTPNGKYQFHVLLLKIPIIKTIITKIAVARFARTFSSLMSSGISVLEALEITGGAIGNKVIEKELKSAAQEVRNGKQLSQPIGASDHFPAIVSQMLAVGEETGQTDEILVKVADFYEEEVSTFIGGISSLIEPLMIIVLGVMVGVIAVSVMLPIMTLSQNIGN